MLGANGAGKSTLLKAIAGLVQPQTGARITFDGKDLLGLPAHEIVETGIALVPEGRGIFAELTVRENLELGAYASARAPARAESRAIRLELFPRLARARRTARPHHERRRAANGRHRPRADVLPEAAAAR